MPKPSAAAPRSSTQQAQGTTLNRHGAFIIGGALVLLALLSLGLLLRDHPSKRPELTPIGTGHIHGIGVDPADGAVYFGAHFGMFKVSESGDVVPVGRVRNDTMAFTVVGEKHFLASGHPDLTSDQPAHLGLIESTDAAQSWDTTALAGEADFHALEATAARTWGIDAVAGRLLTSTDRVSWTSIARGEFVDLAGDPTDADQVLVTTGDGQLRAHTDRRGFSAVLAGAPLLAFIDWPAPDELVGLAQDGGVALSMDGGATWNKVGQVPGQPTALEVTSGRWYAATDRGLFESTDGGGAWTSVTD